MWTGLGIVCFCFILILILVTIESFIDLKNKESTLDSQNEDNIDFNSLKNLSKLFWMLCIICALLYSSIIPFNNIASAFLTKEYFYMLNKQEAQNLAGTYMATPFFISTFFVPAIGLFIDKHGKRTLFLSLTCFLGIFTYLLFFINLPLLAFICLGFTYSLLAATIWPCFSLVCNNNTIGLAIGICTSIQNLGLSISPMIIAYIYSSTKNYYNVSLYYSN